MNTLAISSSDSVMYVCIIVPLDHSTPERVAGRQNSERAETPMRKTLLALAASIAIMTAGTLVSGSAQAMTISTPAGVAAAIDDTNLAQDVAYVCRRVWACGPYGCGWRRSCYWTRPYRPYRPWRRHWRRW